jgi:microcystin-dependent protein
MIHKTYYCLRVTLAAIGLATLVIASGPSHAQDEPFIGQIDYFGFNFAPRGWAKCEGQLLPIDQNQSLYSLLGTNYGGNGRTDFALPDMRGRIPIHVGSGYSLASKGGAESQVLSGAELPEHSHSLRATTTVGNRVLPGGNVLADDAPDETYRNKVPNTSMHADAVGASPSGAHDNMPPYLVVNCSIALQGLFPSRN